MANLLIAAVTIEDSWLEDGPGKKVGAIRAKLVLTGQGGATNKILASLFGWDKFISSSPASADGDDHIYVTSPSYDGTYLQIKASATDALADITDTVRVILRGSKGTYL